MPTRRDSSALRGAASAAAARLGGGSDRRAAAGSGPTSRRPRRPSSPLVSRRALPSQHQRAGVDGRAEAAHKILGARRKVGLLQTRGGGALQARLHVRPTEERDRSSLKMPHSRTWLRHLLVNARKRVAATLGPRLVRD